MAVKNRPEAPPESDRFASAPHPRDTHVLFGHEAAEAEFLDAYRAGRLPHAWILGGPQGIGKATLAWRMARFVAAHPDFSALPAQQAKNLDLDPAHPVARKYRPCPLAISRCCGANGTRRPRSTSREIAVDDVRRAIHIFEQAAGEGGWRMVIVDSADDFNPNSANALLKMIEEPPPRSLFLIVAHQPGRILPDHQVALPHSDPAQSHPRADRGRRARRARCSRGKGGPGRVVARLRPSGWL